MKKKVFAFALSCLNIAFASDANLIFNKHSENIALIHTKNNKSGTGFFISSDLILTNRHVVTGLDKITNTWDAPKEIIKKNGQKFSRYEVMYCSKRVDICLISLREGSIKTKSSWPADRNIQVGEDLFIIGHPSGVTSPIISPGIASSEKVRIPWVDFKNRPTFFDGFSTTAPISPGSSGSPVFSKNGDLLGVAVGSLENTQNLNFVISSNEINLFLDKIGLQDWESIGVLEYGSEIVLNKLTKMMLDNPGKNIEGNLRKTNDIFEKIKAENAAQEIARIKNSPNLKRTEVNKRFFLIGSAMKAGDFKEERVHLQAIIALTSESEEDHKIALRRLESLKDLGQ